MCDMAEELVDVILDMLWQLETQPGGADAAREPYVSQRSAAAEVAALARYRLVCRRWDSFFRKKTMALRFESPMSAAQLRWLTTGPAIVRSLCFAAEEQRAFMVLGSPSFQARSASSLTTLRGVPLSGAADLTTRLLPYSELRHLQASGISSTLHFADLPPSLQTLEVAGLGRCGLRSGLPRPEQASPAEASTSAAGGGTRGAASTALPAPPLNPSLRSISLASSNTLQVYPDWLAGAQGEVSLRCKDLVLPLPPKATDGETRFMRIEALAALLACSRISRLRLSYKEMVMLDFVASAWPVVVYVLLEGSALLAVLEHNHPGVFEALKSEEGATLVRRRVGQAAAAAPGSGSAVASAAAAAAAAPL